MRFWTILNVSSVHVAVESPVPGKGALMASTRALSRAVPTRPVQDNHLAFTLVPFAVPRTRASTAAHPLWTPRSVGENEIVSASAAAPPGTSGGPATTNCPPRHVGHLEVP